MKKEKEHFHIFDKNTQDSKAVHYDVCIIGGGPAGLTAAIYASRYGLHTALISKDIGGMCNLAHKIENYPGFEGSGFELMKKFFEQAKKFGAEFLNSEVNCLEKDKTGFIVELTDGKVAHSKTLIIALGTEKRRLEIPGEKELLGKGVSYCSTCDANFFRNKTVGVVGGSDSAAKSALLLSGIAKKVYIIYRRNQMRCEKIMEGRIKLKKNIALVFNSVLLNIKGKQKVESIEILQAGSGKKEIKLDGIFIEAGSIPVTNIVKKLGIKLDKNKYIDVNENMETNIPGVYAAGDGVKSRLKQVVVAAAQGAIAAKSAYDYLNKRN